MLIEIIFSLISVSALGQNIKEYKDSIHQFRISLPENWTVKLPRTEYGVRLTGAGSIIEGKDTIVASLIVMVFPAKLDENLDIQYKKLKAATQEQPLFSLNSEGDISIDSLNFKWMDAKFYHQVPNAFFRSYILLGLKGESSFMFTFMTKATNYEKFFPLFKKIMESLKI